MRWAARTCWLAVLGWLLIQAGCSSSNTTCTCTVQNGGMRRTIACGDSACIDGTTTVCTEQGKTVLRDACSAPPTASEVDSGGPMPVEDAGSRHFCDDLSSFCDTSCGTPASAAADCRATATSGDEAA